MDNLLQTIEAFFVQISDRDLQRLVVPENSREEKTEAQSLLTRVLQKRLPSYTLDQVKNVQSLMQHTWMKGKAQSPLKYKSSESILNILLWLSDNSLIMQGGRPVCRYSELMRWHNITTVISEDILTTSYLASYDAGNGVGRTDFEWLPAIPHDNNELNALTRREVTELHHHLYGSSLTAELSWLALMNHLCTQGQCKQVEADHRKQVMLSDEDEETSLYARIIKAAAIRLHLYSIVNAMESPFDSTELKEYVRLRNADDASMKAENLRRHLWSFMFLGKAFRLKDDDAYGKVVDYAIPRGVEDTDCAILVGERKLLYDAFKLVYAGETDYFTERLLYTYLVMKGKFRNEIIQTNEYKGFANFQLYQDRKLVFIPDMPVYKKLLVRLAVATFVSGEEDGKRYLETRITPSNTPHENKMHLHFCMKAAGNGKTGNCNFIFHFIKKKDDTNPDSLKKRHHKLREENKIKALALAKLWNKDDETCNRFVGIDAASSEIACRPEVFAHAFRYLRNVTLRQRPGKKPLGITYHVGEDFLDVVDGLRAIDEAIRFLELRDGDRIGHGLALGVDVGRYYQKRFMTVTTKEQVWLDNVAWLHAMCRKHGVGSESLYKLEAWYREYFNRIYSNEESVPDIYSYYNSMLLRGDDPELYAEDGTSLFHKRRSDDWGTYDICQSEDVRVAREDKEACRLYYKYHYDAGVKKRGDASTEEKVTPAFLGSVKAIQEEMMNLVEHKHLAIECNPTSNCKIGDFDLYIEHPIYRFFNKDIKTPYESRHLNVSINTDDKGVFSTSLEREYALLAWALEKEGDKNPAFKNSPYDIIAWLDRIRLMGIGQKFA